MAVKRVKDINISERGFTVAIEGKVDDAFVDKDLCIYLFEEQLYLYLKDVGYDRVFFYNRGPGYGLYSYEREALASLISDSETEATPSTRKSLLKPKTTRTEGSNIKRNGKRFCFTNVKDQPLKTRLVTILEDTSLKTIIFFTSAGFEFKDEAQGFIDHLTMVRNQVSASGSMNKILFMKGAGGLFENHFFTESAKDPRNVFSVGFPDEEEYENWVNRNRILGSLEWKQVFSFPYKNLAHQISVQQKTIIELEKILKSDISHNNNTIDHFRMEEFNETFILQHLSKIQGQQDNLTIISDAVTTWINRPDEYKLPLVLMFAGTSGTGKTFTAEMITEALKSRGFVFVKLPMNEYQNKGDGWKLLGSAPGYVGSGEDTALISAYKRSKRLVILFDEIEKADLSLFETIMTLMEKGELTNSKGELMDFRKSIIIFTTNLAMNDLWDEKQKYMNGQIDANTFKQNVKTILINHRIKTEVCGRISEILVYNRLTSEVVARIAIQEIRSLGKIYRMTINNISKNMLKSTIAAASNSNMGARPIKDFVQQQLERKIQKVRTCFEGKTVDVDDNLDIVETAEDHLLSIEEIINRL